MQENNMPASVNKPKKSLLLVRYEKNVLVIFNPSLNLFINTFPMSKKLVVILLLLTCVWTNDVSFAKAVDETTAKTIGYNFLLSHGLLFASSDFTTSYIAQTTSGTTSINDYYVFALTNGKGWVIISADDNVRPVLAYSSNSEFTFNHVAPATRNWLNGYKNQIDYVIEHHLPARAGTAEAWASYKTAIQTTAARTTIITPLLTTQWDQEPFYNALCPYDHTYSALTATGCVATAMAQVLKYWNWPTVGCGYHSYTDDPYGVLNADFGTTAYQWSLMPNIVSGANNAVATLMYHCGVSVEMAYGTDAVDGSGAYINTVESAITPCTEFALKANFHYKRSLKSIIRFGEGAGSGYDTIPEATWINALKADLDLRHPIIYGGANDTTGGHCWVCDGYDASNLFHFNWGWSGSSDGYYTVDNLAPPSLGAGGGGGNFNFDQTAIVGIVPDSFPSNPGGIQLLSYLNNSSTPAQYGKPFSISTKILNTQATAYSGDFCAWLYDSVNNVVGTVNTLTGVIIAAGDSSTTLSFATTGMYGLVTGLYGARIMYRPTGSPDWTPVANNGNFYNFTYVAIANDTDMELNFSASVTPGVNLSTGGAISVSANITNWGVAAFSGNIKATLNSTTDGTPLFTIQELSSQFLDINASQTYTFANGTMPLTPGTYALEILHQYNGTGNYYLTGSTYACNPILVNVSWVAGTPAVALTNDVVLYPNPAHDQLHITLQGVTADNIKISDIQGRIVTQLSVNGQSNLQLPLVNFAPGIYIATIQTPNGVIVRKFVVN